MAFTWRQLRENYIPVVALVLTVATVLLAIALTQLFTQAAAIGETRAIVASHNERFNQVDRRFDKVDEKLAGIETLVKKSLDQLGSLESKVTEAQINPMHVLTAAGLPSETLFFVVRVEGRSFAFPRTEDAMKMLQDAGIKSEQITPGVVGFPLTLPAVQAGSGG